MRFDTQQPFLEHDPFHPSLMVEGTLVRGGGKDYGALDIMKVNGGYDEQRRIYGTPKLEYPFDRNGNYRFPSAHTINSYRKYDGTNIFMFRYFSSGIYRYTSYKTRLTPFLREPFLSLWRRVLERHPQITQLWNGKHRKRVAGFSFEMFGSQNPHLIKYDVPIDAVLLFGITEEGEVVCLEDIDPMGVPTADLIGTITKDYVFEYEQAKEGLSKGLDIITDNEGEPMLFSGDEGHVWYLQEKDTDRWRMFKCKPEEILSIHWSHTGIPHTVVQATALNGLENADRLTVDLVTDLLLEEFAEEQVNLSLGRIKKAVRIINDDLRYDDAIRLALADVPKDLDVPDVMRHLSKTGEFGKKDMRRVYSKVVKLRGAENV